MSRLTHLLVVLGLSGTLAGATIAACGHPGSPGELPVAPRPTPVDPNGAPQTPTATPALAPVDAGPTVTKSALRTRELPTPDFAPTHASASEPSGTVVGTKGPYDAGTGDGYSPPLPPIPDGSVPIDSRVEPKRGE